MTRSRLAKTYDFFLRHTTLSVAIMTAPAFVLLAFVSWQELRLPAGATIFVTAGCILFTFVKCLGDKYNDLAKTSGQYVLASVLQGTNVVTNAKLRRFLSYIDSNDGQSDLRPFPDITQPRLQIERILDTLQLVLSEICGIGRDNIGLSIAYRPNGSEKWSWLHTINFTDDVSLDDLLANGSSTLRQIIDRKEPLIFYPDKRVAYSKRHYLPTPRDSAFDMRGSIMCLDSSARAGEKGVHAVLSIITYGEQLCNANDRVSIDKITSYIVGTFQMRLRLELSLLYIKEHMKAGCVSCPLE